MILDTTEQQVAFIAGRLRGLAGTARFELSDEVRGELKQMAERLEQVVQQDK